MSATPIPRTLAQAVHGDLDTTILDEKPPGRKPVETRAVPDGRLSEVIEAAGRAISRGERVFWVCPRVDAEEDDSSAVARHASLKEALGIDAGLVHGRMSTGDKDAALDDFRAGRTRLLVATTVIEVGVDVPEATIMVIEHAEGFGLAQLHQLRAASGAEISRLTACCSIIRRWVKSPANGWTPYGARMTALPLLRPIFACAALATCWDAVKPGLPSIESSTWRNMAISLKSPRRMRKQALRRALLRCGCYASY